ncbi:MAG TPA: hypothetical protein VIK98_04800 [Limnochordales bacterium]
MGFEELFSLLFFLYVLGSVLSGLLRRSADPGAPTGTGEGPDLVLDMEELERRLRRASQERLGQPQPPAGHGRGETPPSLVPPAAPAVPPTAARAVQPAKPAVRSSTMAPRVRGVPFDDDLGQDWSAPAAPAPRPAAPRPRVAAGLPPTVAALVREGHPWLAAVVMREILDPPRALRPYRVWPRV